MSLKNMHRHSGQVRIKTEMSTVVVASVDTTLEVRRATREVKGS